jgi:hypothetical protein
MGLPEQAQAGGTLADAEVALRKGRASSVLVLVAFGSALVGALVFLIGGDDQARVFGEIGRQINGAKHAHFDQFWACALPGENIADLGSNTELAAQIEGRGRERGRAYGVHLRDRCLAQLEPLVPQLESLIVSPELQADVSAIIESTSQLRGAISDYVAYLDDPALQYEDEAARPLVNRIARAWYDFRRGHVALNAAIKPKLK